eukprot:2599221-Prymnesium_polylepis.1
MLSPDPVTTLGCLVLGGCVWGSARPHCPHTPCGLHPPCVLSPDCKSRPRDDPGAPRPRGMRARGAPDRTAPPRRG